MRGEYKHIAIPDNGKEPEKVLEINELRVAFGRQVVLKNISFSLLKGENIGILGKSGSGKSVLIKCLCGLLQPASGRINVLGKRIDLINKKDLEEIRKKIGFLFQSGALYDSMSVRENLEFPLRRINRRISAKELNERVSVALDNVGLTEAIDKMPSELSGGMRKRVALARTIISDPVIILYDEPTTGLDPITSSEISQLINKIRKKYNTSALIITHDVACAREVTDRVIMLKDGEVKAQGRIEELEYSKDKWISAFFGNN